MKKITILIIAVFLFSFYSVYYVEYYGNGQEVFASDQQGTFWTETDWFEVDVAWEEEEDSAWSFGSQEFSDGVGVAWAWEEQDAIGSLGDYQDFINWWLWLAWLGSMVYAFFDFRDGVKYLLWVWVARFASSMFFAIYNTPGF